MITGKTMLKHLSIEDLEFLPANPRAEIYDDSLKRLSRSLEKDGLIEPIVVRPLGNKFEVVAGERRVRAAIIANIPKIPAIIREGLTDKEASRLRLLENMERKDLTMVEKVEGIKAHMQKHNLSIDDVAHELGLKPDTVKSWISNVENLAPSIKSNLAFIRKLSPDVLALLGKYNFETQEKLAEAIVNNKLTDWTARRYVSMFETSPEENMGNLDRLAKKAKSQLKTIAVTLPVKEAEKVQKMAKEYRKKEEKASEKIKKFLQKKRRPAPKTVQTEPMSVTDESTIDMPMESPSIEGLRDLEIAKISEEYKFTGAQFRKLGQMAKQAPNASIKELANEIAKQEIPRIMVIEIPAKIYNALKAYSNSEKIFTKEAALSLVEEGLIRHGFLKGVAP